MTEHLSQRPEENSIPINLDNYAIPYGDITRRQFESSIGNILKLNPHIREVLEERHFSDPDAIILGIVPINDYRRIIFGRYGEDLCAFTDDIVCATQAVKDLANTGGTKNEMRLFHSNNGLQYDYFDFIRQQFQENFKENPDIEENPDAAEDLHIEFPYRRGEMNPADYLALIAQNLMRIKKDENLNYRVVLPLQPSATEGEELVELERIKSRRNFFKAIVSAVVTTGLVASGVEGLIIVGDNIRQQRADQAEALEEKAEEIDKRTLLTSGKSRFVANAHVVSVHRTTKQDLAMELPTEDYIESNAWLALQPQKNITVLISARWDREEKKDRYGKFLISWRNNDTKIVRGVSCESRILQDDKGKFEKNVDISSQETSGGQNGDWLASDYLDADALFGNGFYLKDIPSGELAEIIGFVRSAPIDTYETQKIIAKEFANNKNAIADSNSLGDVEESPAVIGNFDPSFHELFDSF